MTADALAYLSISELAARIACKELSPVAVTEALLARIERHDGALNSYITVMTESARRAAAEAEKAVAEGRPLGLLHGVPIALKDLFATKGVRTTYACRAFADWVPDYDATVVERLVSAGAVIVGKLNLHECSAGTSSLVSIAGPVRNPWNLDYIAGGSSGGSGAAVAAGLVYGALGSDTAMSIRHPAALCGVVGLKPTYGRISKHGALVLAWSLDHVGPMTRTVRDAALMLQAMAGHDPRDPASRDLPVPDYIAALKGDIRGLKVGIPRAPFFDNCEPATLTAVEKAIGILEDLGAQIAPCELPHAADAALVGRMTMMIECAAYHAQRMQEQPELLDASLRSMIEIGRMFSGVQYVQAQRTRASISKAFVETMERFDVLVMPTTPVPACKASEDGTQLAGLRNQNTMPFNLSGLPAISVPCGFNGDGMPIGLQIVGRPFDEATVLKVAEAYERATEWHTRRPDRFL
jgi:aspartyl-tRNA(Asn)/glutamyl-tRNA(Gln) amidotransferase subunit A